MVAKFTNQPTNKQVVTKINDVIDAMGTVKSVNSNSPDSNGNVSITIPTVPTNVSSFTNDSKYIANTATGTNSLTISGTATTATGAINIGLSSQTAGGYGSAFGYASKAKGSRSVALGWSSNATGADSIQLGYGTNSTGKTLSVGFYNLSNYTLLDGTTGLIPLDRIAVMGAADSSSAGTKGLVPAPASGDNSKFLRGDGTWQSVSADSGANIDLSNLSSTGEAKFVNTTGDTMTGDLFIKKESPFVYLTATNATSSVDPSSTISNGILYKDSTDSYSFGGLEKYYQPDGRRYMHLWSANKARDNWAVLDIGFDANNNAFCTFPNTTCVDGAWVMISQTLVGTAVSLNGSTDLKYTVTLPDDGYVYEVMLRADANTGSTTGNYFIVGVKYNASSGTDVLTQDWAFICGARTRAASSVGSQGTVVIPLKKGTDNLLLHRHTNYNGSTTLYSLGYRRLGTNS